MKQPDFEWDDLKNAQNTEKHGVLSMKPNTPLPILSVLSSRTWITAGMKIVFSALAR
jgi:hypothetical protein